MAFGECHMRKLATAGNGEINFAANIGEKLKAWRISINSLLRVPFFVCGRDGVTSLIN